MTGTDVFGRGANIVALERSLGRQEFCTEHKGLKPAPVVDSEDRFLKSATPLAKSEPASVLTKIMVLERGLLAS